MAGIERWAVKVLCIFGLLINQCIFVLLPIRVSRAVEKQGKRGVFIISLLSCFGGGVFFGAYLTHLSPEVRASLEEVLMEPRGVTYPIPEALAGLGFFLILFMEKAILFFRDRSDKKREHDCQKLADAISRFRLAELRPSNLERAPDAFALDPETANGKKLHAVNSTSSYQELVEGENDAAKTRSIIFVVALALDSIFEGLALGLMDNKLDVLSLFVAIVSHEFVMSFCIGMELVKHYPTKKVVLAGISYAFTPVFGAVIGTAILETRHSLENQTTVDIVSGVLSAISAGTFIYCSFVGILSEHLTSDNGFWKALATLLGFSLMAAMAAIPEDSLSSEEGTMTTVAW